MLEWPSDRYEMTVLACTWVEVPKLNEPGMLFRVVGVPDFDWILV